jgi:hypothetical protein
MKEKTDLIALVLAALAVATFFFGLCRSSRGNKVGADQS